MAANGSSSIKIMVVGDSISHGREGDWTWRYRLWEWLRREAVASVFVGPYKGTVPPEEPEPPRPPPLASEPPRAGHMRSDGGYAKGTSEAFLANSNHFSAGGRQAMQAKELIAHQVAAYQPDLCLVQLGFNDLGWFASGPHGTLASMERLVQQARSAKPDLKFAIANVPHRTLIPGREDLPLNTDIYNSLLAGAVPSWSTAESPVALVHFCENYSCGEHLCDAAYDGLHPNALGEYQLARAFTRTLVTDFRIGRRALAIPPHIPTRPTPTPTNVHAATAPSGIVVTWDAVYGAFWYDVRCRLVSPDSDANPDDWTTHYSPSTRHDTTFTFAGQRWEYQVRASGGDTVKSPWSPTVSAVAHPETAPAPPHIRVHATTDGFRIAWDPLPDREEVDRYGVFSLDRDVPGTFLGAVGIRGSGGRVERLVPGHHYGVAVQTWTAAGGGIPGGARAVTVGRGTPLPPVRVRVAAVVSRTAAELTWRGDVAAAGYRVFARRAAWGVACSSLKEVACDVPEGEALVERRLLTGLFPSVWDFEFAVSAYNGDDESDVSQWIAAPPSLTESDSVRISLEYLAGTPSI